MSDAARDGELDLGSVGRALMRKKWWILGPAIAVAALSFAAVNVLTPRYKSEARIILEGSENVFFRPEAARGGIERDRAVDQEAISSQVQLALSRDLARQVIKQLRLGELPEFDSTLRGVSLIRYSLSMVGLSRDPLSMSPEERVLGAYYDRLTVFPVDKSRVISIEFQSSDPELAAKVANTVADTYLSMQQGARQEQTRAASKWLTGEIDVLRKQVAEAEAKLEEFRARTNFMIGTNGTTLSSQSLGEMNRDLATARSQKTDLESKARVIRDLLKRGGPLEFSDMLNSDRMRSLHTQRVAVSGQLAEQSTTLMDNHPRIKELRAQVAELDRQLRDEAARLARSFETDAKFAGDRVESIQTSLDQLKKLAASSSGDDVQLRALERQAKAQRDLLESYLAKNSEATARDRLGAIPADARIISRAIVSNTPFFPKKLPIVLIATLATLFVSAGFIATGELLGGNVYRGEEPVAVLVEEPVVAAPQPVEPVVAATPSAKRSWKPSFLRKKDADAPVPADSVAEELESAAVSASVTARVDDFSVDDIAKAIREAGDTGRLVAVIGAAQGVGTTQSAIALARNLARDTRVLMIDLAFDHPSLAAISSDPGAPGVADLARGEASFGEIITRDRSSRAQVIAAGRVGPETAGAIMSQRLSIGMQALSRAYDHVIVDAGALPGIQAERIAQLAPCAVLVAGDLGADEAEAARARLSAAGFSDIAVFAGVRASDSGIAHGVAA
jgi:succinoglycan biosynthesis transport protein ExoP